MASGVQNIDDVLVPSYDSFVVYNHENKLK